MRRTMVAVAAVLALTVTAVAGPAVSAVQTEAVKRIVSVVPVEEDGSAYFEAPAGESLFFQLLNDQYRALHTMRSFSGVMPDERLDNVDLVLHAANADQLQLTPQSEHRRRGVDQARRSNQSLTGGLASGSAWPRVDAYATHLEPRCWNDRLWHTGRSAEMLNSRLNFKA